MKTGKKEKNYKDCENSNSKLQHAPENFHNVQLSVVSVVCWDIMFSQQFKITWTIRAVVFMVNEIYTIFGFELTAFEVKTTMSLDVL